MLDDGQIGNPAESLVAVGTKRSVTEVEGCLTAGSLVFSSSRNSFSVHSEIFRFFFGLKHFQTFFK